MFETWFANIFGYPDAVAVSSVRFGLYSTLKALSYPAGSEILCTPITVRPVIDAIHVAGLTVKFVDISPDDFSPTLDGLAAALTHRSRAVLVTHLWATAADLRPLAGWCNARKLDLLEDGSQCLGGWIGETPVGLAGLAGLFSLGPTKTLSLLRGAVLVSRNRELTERVRAEHSLLPLTPRRYVVAWAAFELAIMMAFTPPTFRLLTRLALSIGQRVGWDDRLQRLLPVPQTPRIARYLRTRPSPGQLSLALSTAAHHSVLLAKRREIAAVYRRGLGGLLSLRLPRPAEDCRGNGWVNVVFHHEPEALRSFLWRRHRVDTARPSLDPCHELLGASAAAPTASRLLNTAVYLPCPPSLIPSDISRIISGLRTFTDGALGDPAWI